MEKENVAYSEIWSILEQLEENDKKKIPEEVIEIIDSRRDKEYNAQVNMDIPLSEQNLNKHTVDMLCYLEMEYLSTPEQKAELIKVYKQNEERLSQKFDINRVFEERRKQILPVVIEKEYTWYERIWNKIKNFFHISK